MIRPSVREYLDTVCAQVRCREVHGEVRLELEGHIAEMVDDLVSSGASEDEAVRQALSQMGDPVRLGQQLHLAHQPRTEWGLLAAVALFAVIGILAMYGLDASGGPVGYLFERQLLYTALGLGAAGFLSLVDYRKLAKWSPYLFWGTNLAAAAALLWALLTWQNLYLRYVPTFVAHTPFLLIPALAGIFSRWDWERPQALLKALPLLAAPFLLYLHAGKLVLCVIYAAGFLAVALASKPSRRQLLTLGGLVAAGAGGVLLEAMRHPYLVYRLRAVLNPGAHAMGAAYQQVQSHMAIRAAGPWGQGLTASWEALPGVSTDFVLTHVVYTMGWVAGSVFCLIAGFFIWRLVRVARRARDHFGSLLVTGLVSLFAVQFVLNLLMVSGLAPATSVPLPFISFGSQQVVQLAAVGMALSVYRRKDMNPTPD